MSTTPQLVPLAQQLVADLVARQSDSRGENTKSIEDQIEIWKRKCERDGLIPGEVHIERDTSGTLPFAKRKGLVAVAKRVDSGQAQVVVMAYAERLTRDPAVKDEFVDRVEAKGGVVDSCDMGVISNRTAMQWFSGTVAFAQAKVVSMQAREKTQASKQRNIDAGIPPFPHVTPAYEKISEGPNKGRLKQSKLAPLLKQSIKMRLKGKSLEECARWLTSNGLRMSTARLRTIYASRLLVGEIHFGDFTPNLNAIDKPLIDHATYMRLNKTSATRGRNAKSERLLARQQILFCGSCGARMTVRSAAKQSYHYYKCGAADLCPQPVGIPAVWIEDYVRDEAIRLSSTSAKYRGRASARDEVEAARVEMEELRERVTSTIESFRDLGVGDHAAARETLSALNEEHVAAVARHDRLLAVAGPTKVVTTRRDWDKLSLDGKRGVIHATIARITIAPRTGKRLAPGVVDVNRIDITTREVFGQ